MATGQSKINIYLKKFLPQQQMVLNFLDYLRNQDIENLKLQYPNQGFFYGNSLAGSGPDEITAATPSLATDGQGNLLKLDPAEAVATFENALGIPYHVGMRYNVLEQGTEVNVRTGQIEYTFFKDAIGEKGEPNSVTDNGTTLRLIVDSIFEAGVSHAGRQVIVYLKRAVGQADAFFTGVVQWDGSNNYVDTTHLIGQTAGLVSIDPSDYWVFAPGLTIRRNTDLSLDPVYVYYGIVTGVGAGNTPTPADIDTSLATVLYTGGSFSSVVDNLRSFLVGGGDISWDLANEELSWTADLRVKLASRPFDYQMIPDTIVLQDGECAYIDADGVTGGIKSLIVVPLADVPDVETAMPIVYRNGNDIIFRGGALELEGDDVEGTVTTGRIDGVTNDLLQYIGAKNESDATPDYTNATGVAKTNIHLTDNDDLTKSIKKLELRNDVIPRVKAIDLLATVLPTGPAVTIDGQAIANGHLVLFANPAINKIYKATGIGVAVVWIEMPMFGGVSSPFSMALVAVQDSASEFIRNIWQYTSAIGWKPYNLSEVMSEPTGFPNQTDSEISFDDGTRTFTIQPKAPATEFYYFQKGRLYKVNSAKTVVVPDSEGMHYIYFDGVNLLSTQTFNDDLVKTYTFVSTLYWDSVNNVSVMFTEERHALTMDGKTHEYLHNTIGVQWVSGLGMTYVPGDGSTDADAQLAVGDGVIYDEDIKITPTDDPAPSERFEQILDPIAELPILYRSGASGDWRKFTADTFPAHLGTARLTFNDPAGPWTTPDASADGNFVAMWLFATNDVRHPIISIMGQREDATLNDAKANNLYEAMDFGNIPSLEMKVLYRVIFQTSSAFANTNKSFIADVVDLRRAEDTSLGSYQPSAHNNLAARNAPNAHPASSIQTVLTNFLGALSADDTEVQKALETIDKQFQALRIHEHPSNKQRVVVTGSSVTLSTGTVLEQQIRNLIVSFDGIEIDFQTGEIFESDGITPFNGGLNDFTPVIPPVGENRWASLTLLPNTVNPDNTINFQPLILISGANNFRAVFASGTKVGQVKLEEDTGAIADIFQDAITQQSMGGGGGGDGTGDANEYLLLLENRLMSDGFTLKWLTPNIFKIHEDDRTDNSSTGVFDIANGEFDFDAAAEFMLSINLYGSSFLANEKENYHLELDVLWNTEDTNATYQAAKDGVTFETVTMEKVENSKRYRGVHVFAEPPATLQYQYNDSNSDTDTQLNATTRQAFAIKIPALALGVKKKILSANIYVNKTGLAVGDLFVRIRKDNAGAPTGDLVGENLDTINIESLTAGLNTIAVDLSSVLVQGNYWLVLETSQAYKTDFTASAGARNLAVRTDTSVPSYSEGNSYEFDGTTWAAIANTHGAFQLLGFTFDLRVKIIASMQSALHGFGAFYGEQQPFVYEDHMAIERFEIDGDDDVTELTLTKMIPDAMTCKVYVVNSGQVLRYPAFALDGRKLIFASGQFLSPGNTITVLVDQSEAQVFDNSDANANLMASNGLGSTDPGIDRSNPGVGIKLRSPNGQLWHATITNAGAWQTTPL